MLLNGKEKKRMRHVKFLILGGGLSGASFVYFLKHQDYFIVEKEKELGGYCKTNKRNGFVWDYAGHFFHFKNDGIRRMYLQSSEEQEPIQKNTKIYLNGKFIDYPFQTHIYQLSKDQLIDCIYGLFDNDICEDDCSFLEMLYSKYGSGITELFLRPYNEKLYSCDLNSLDKEAMGRFFPKADKIEIIKSLKNNAAKSYNDYFYYPSGGAQIFFNHFAASVDPNKVLFNSYPKSLDLKNKECVLNDGQVISYDYLISSIPLNSFLNVISNSIVHPNELTSNKVLCFNIGLNKNFDSYSSFTGIHWVYFPDKSLSFYRIGFYNNISKTDKISMYIEIGFDQKTNIDIKAQYKKTIRDLIKIGILNNENEIMCYESIVMDPAYVHINKALDKKIVSLMSSLKNDNVFLLGRYGRWTYCSMEDCIEMSRKLAIEMEENK